MPELDDQQLLGEFVGRNSEAAFTALVARYVNLVYSTALRFTGNPHHAEEITQAVFIILARKAGGLRRGTVLSGWLYQTARLTAANYLRGEIRRQRREQEAYMQSTLNGSCDASSQETWSQIAPLLDDAMGRLGETDRNVVVLHFFENKTAREVAAALKLTEAAAHKRVNRVLDKLRKFFSQRGVTLAAAAIAGAVSANSAHAAPVGLAESISAVAVAKGAAAGTSTLTLVKGALKIMAWTKAKTAVVVCVIVAVTATTGVVGYKLVNARPVLQSSAIDDIQPDGTIRSQVTSEMINYLGETLTTNSSQDAILHIDRITDALGQPIKFTTRRDGGLWRYEETYNRPIPPGGKIVETVEGTETGLVMSSGELGEYQYQIDIATGYEGNTHRVQVVDLPAGAILLEKQPANAVEMTNNGRIELRVDKIIPPGGNLPIRYRYRLSANAN
jgi:RNA polymerase sigma factor (sigma-70 family)